ncbi:MAG: hypothetical protein M3Y41_04140, partial [Pseudomonadota bacterium]|nr:hypothetical protein [Pseudomonadota bacterium]
SRESRPALHRIARSAASGLVHSKVPLSRRQGVGARAGRPTPMTAPVAGPMGDIAGIEDPPSLYVVVDAEAERDAAEPFDQSLAGVGAMAAQEQAQAVFDTFGLRPIYALDYAVASQAEGYEPLRGILDRHACAVGARLRPWINPPFEDAAPDRAPSDEDLAAAMEERKLRALVGAIQENLRVSPLFFKAGRHGYGPRTMETLARLGFAVAFNVPSAADPAAESSIASVPMTRAQLGPPWAPLPPRLLARPLLARLGLANTVALTPEGVTAGEQVRLIRSLVARGHRIFTLHYHGPSLAPSSAPSSAPGSTRHARTGTEAQAVLQRIEAVCRFFFEELGGLPGNPADLVPQPMRERVWPRPERASPTSLPDAVTAPSGG